MCETLGLERKDSGYSCREASWILLDMGTGSLKRTCSNQTKSRHFVTIPFSFHEAGITVLTPDYHWFLPRSYRDRLFFSFIIIIVKQSMAEYFLKCTAINNIDMYMHIIIMINTKNTMCIYKSTYIFIYLCTSTPHIPITYTDHLHIYLYI